MLILYVNVKESDICDIRSYKPPHCSDNQLLFGRIINESSESKIICCCLKLFFKYCIISSIFYFLENENNYLPFVSGGFLRG